MTDNERVLHTVLSTCLKPIPEAFGDKLGTFSKQGVMKARLEYVECRLEEISKIVGDQVQVNAYNALNGA